MSEDEYKIFFVYNPDQAFLTMATEYNLITVRLSSYSKEKLLAGEDSPVSFNVSSTDEYEIPLAPSVIVKLKKAEAKGQRSISVKNTKQIMNHVKTGGFHGVEKKLSKGGALTKKDLDHPKYAAIKKFVAGKGLVSPAQMDAILAMNDAINPRMRGGGPVTDQ
jgi:hypothetical protein